MPRATISHLAREDILDIWLYIARDNVEAADRFVDRLNETFQMLAESPGMGHIREELAPSLRSLVFDNYLIFYRSLEDDIEIVRVLSGYRDLPRLFHET